MALQIIIKTAVSGTLDFFCSYYLFFGVDSIARQDVVDNASTPPAARTVNVPPTALHDPSAADGGDPLVNSSMTGGSEPSSSSLLTKPCSRPEYSFPVTPFASDQS